MQRVASPVVEVGVLDMDAWAAWPPEEISARLQGIEVPWVVAGGWALDLWHGRETRPHEDLEIAVSRHHLGAVRRCLSEFRFYSAGSGELHPLAPDTEPPLEVHQTWVLDEAAGAWRTDVFLGPGDDETWVCRRDESLRLPRASVVGRTAEGIPYLRPEFVLLFKAKAARPKDEFDFTEGLPYLSAGARAWLGEALRRVHPGHPWIERLES